jgi:hypothetical protein
VECNLNVREGRQTAQRKLQPSMPLPRASVRPETYPTSGNSTLTAHRNMKKSFWGSVAGGARQRTTLLTWTKGGISIAAVIVLGEKG